jgi:hypothetical protein
LIHEEDNSAELRRSLFESQADKPSSRENANRSRRAHVNFWTTRYVARASRQASRLWTAPGAANMGNTHATTDSDRTVQELRCTSIRYGPSFFR